MFEAQVHTVPMATPEDVSGVEGLFDDGIVDPVHVVAVMAQTEGDHYVRGYSTLAMQRLFSQRLNVSFGELAERLPMLMIAGTAGLMSPHATLFVNKPARGKAGNCVARLAVGVASTRPLLPEECGTTVEVELVADAVNTAMKGAGIAAAQDVVSVEMKCPQMTLQRMDDAFARGRTLVSRTPAVASAMSRGAAALGAAVALGEVSAAEISDSVIGRRPDLFTTRGSATAGNDQVAVRVVVIGNVAGAPGGYVAAHSVMEHQLDVVGARAAFKAAGLRLEEGIVVPEDRAKVAAVFVKAGADYLPHCLGRRHTMCSDMLAQYSGHVAKAVAHANVSSIVQDTLVLGKAGAEHQGKPGSNLVCVIANHG